MRMQFYMTSITNYNYYNTVITPHHMIYFTSENNYYPTFKTTIIFKGCTIVNTEM